MRNGFLCTSSTRAFRSGAHPSAARTAGRRRTRPGGHRARCRPVRGGRAAHPSPRLGTRGRRYPVSCATVSPLCRRTAEDAACPHGRECAGAGPTESVAVRSKVGARVRPRRVGRHAGGGRRGRPVGAHDGADGRDSARRAMGRARHSLSDAARKGRVRSSVSDVTESKLKFCSPAPPAPDQHPNFFGAVDRARAAFSLKNLSDVSADLNLKFNPNNHLP